MNSFQEQDIRARYAAGSMGFEHHNDLFILLQALDKAREECRAIYENSVDDKVGMAAADIGKHLGLNLNE